MEIYIRNNKDFPSFLEGLVTEVKDPSRKDEHGNRETCGFIFWRETYTSRRVFGGKNRWDLFYVEAAEGYTFEEVTWEWGEGERPLVPLGQCNGYTIGFNVYRQTYPRIELPNGTSLPSEKEPVDEVDLVSLFPQKVLHPTVRYAISRLPFHQPGGEGSKEERLDLDRVFQDDLVSMYAHNYPDDFRRMHGDGLSGDTLFREIEKKMYPSDD